MTCEIKALKYFDEQVGQLGEKSRRIVYDKIELIKQNPFRFKRVHSKQYSKVFRVRFSIGRREMRLIYVVIEPRVILVCLLDRKRDYKDLERYLARVNKELWL